MYNNLKKRFESPKIYTLHMCVRMCVELVVVVDVGHGGGKSETLTPLSRQSSTMEPLSNPSPAPPPYSLVLHE